MSDNWKGKTLESLEKKVWPALPADEQDWLIITCNKLRKKPLKEFLIEDLRTMIEQDIGLKYLIPIAIEELESNILVEGDCYPGDLLRCILTGDEKYWKEEKNNWERVCALFESKKDNLKNTDIIWEIQKAWFDAYKKFEKIN
jgi:hypothetical protein